MNLSDFDYDLPEAFIAQTPAEPRDASRLLVLDRRAGTVTHRIFRDLGEFLRPGDVLVFNETRVIPARLFGRKAGTGGKVELLLLQRRAPRTWEVLVGGTGLRAGAVVALDGTPGLQAVVLEELDGPRRVVQFSQPLAPLLDQIGQVPLPPYIHTPLADRERYQTVYARTPGSAAAPTAGLHFTPGLMSALQEQGVQFAFVTLHVGLDTFNPVTEADVEAHAMHGEWCEVTPAAAEVINAARRGGRRIIAVGTTAVRTLESAHRAAVPGAAVAAFSGTTDLFILPGYSFGAVDAMLTNFHLPRSTLLMLLAAFAGRETLLAAYETAKGEGYRFYSFGDAMLVL
jgi:S-adenosylmethionine:tRNA ribosyltransferase-isomerase